MLILCYIIVAASFFVHRDPKAIRELSPPFPSSGQWIIYLISIRFRVLKVSSHFVWRLLLQLCRCGNAISWYIFAVNASLFYNTSILKDYFAACTFNIMENRLSSFLIYKISLCPVCFLLMTSCTFLQGISPRNQSSNWVHEVNLILKVNVMYWRSGFAGSSWNLDDYEYFVGGSAEDAG